MGKSKGFPNEDVHQRVNYLYQAALNSIRQNPENLSLCRFYVNTLMVIARRQGMHLHPDVKRTLCKRCCLLLVPGVTAIFRVKKKRQKHTVVTCLGCGTLRRFVWVSGRVTWVDRPESWIDIIVKGKQVTVPQHRQGAGDLNQPKDKTKTKQEKKCTNKMNTQDVTTMLQDQDCSKTNEHTREDIKAAEQHVHQSS